MKAPFVAVPVVLLLGLGSPGHAAEFTCAEGNVACLVAAIRSANGLGEPSTIRLAEGTYTLTATDNDTDGPNGLPSVTRTLIIQGSGAHGTVIERAVNAPDFRLAHVGPTGALTLQALTLRGGRVRATAISSVASGGGILNNGGTVAVLHSRLTGNSALGGSRALGGGLFNNGGVLTVTASTVAENLVAASIPFGPGYGAGLATNGGAVTITNSTIAENQIRRYGGGAVAEAPFGEEARSAVVEIVNTTIARNAGGGLTTGQGRWTVVNGTIAGNVSPVNPGFFVFGEGISAEGGAVVALQNTIVAQNDQDCVGPITSLDHNLVRDPTGCTIALQPHDRTGTAGLAIYTDDGTPGRGHWPLLPTSPAIDAGNGATCPPTDQLGRPRRGVCDIGAVELSPDPAPLAAFVTGFYRYALGREPSPTEVAGWVSFLQADPTVDRARVLTHAFFDGPEYRLKRILHGSVLEFEERRVSELYRAILGRDPEPPGMYGWQQMVVDRLAGIVRLFLSSPEFHSLVPGCDDQDAIRAFEIRVWVNALGRPPDTRVSSCDFFDFVWVVVSSPEYLSVPKSLTEHVVILYRALLAREPRADEVDAWAEYLVAPFIEDQFLDSPEFTARWQQLISSAS